MVFANSINGSNNDFEETSGSFDVADRRRLTLGYVENLGLDLTGGTFTVQGAAATLSATNPAYVTLPSQSDLGELVTYTITADQAFIDDAGSSEIIGNLFGMTTSVAYGEDVPFFLYAVPNDAESAIAFMISRNPAAKVSPAAANIGAPDDAVADAQGDFFSFDNLDETLYDANPCVCLGSFRMQMSASDDWTIQTLSENDGLGRFHDETWFIFPTGVFGGQSGTYFQPNAGTEPTFAAGATAVRFRINRDGMVDFSSTMNTVDNTPAGANVLTLTLPYANDGFSGHTAPLGHYINSGTGARSLVLGSISSSQQFIDNLRFDDGTVSLQNTNFATGFSFAVHHRYGAFADG